MNRRALGTPLLALGILTLFAPPFALSPSRDAAPEKTSFVRDLFEAMHSAVLLAALRPMAAQAPQTPPTKAQLGPLVDPDGSK